MRKLLNTVYVTNELSYLSLDGENIVCNIEGNEKFRIPFDNVELIICFSYLGCSPALMGKCAEKLIPISFISPSGRFLAKLTGETKGNVFLRVSQIDVFRRENLCLIKNTVATKLSNTISLLRRSKHDIDALRADEDMNSAIESSLACDLVEESRCVVERFTLTIINLKILNEDDFEKQLSGAVFLNEEGRKKVITQWQENKRSDIMHAYLNQKIQLGLLPYVQSNLLAKYIRGEIKEYPCYLVR